MCVCMCLCFYVYAFMCCSTFSIDLACLQWTKQDSKTQNLCMCVCVLHVFMKLAFFSVFEEAACMVKKEERRKVTKKKERNESNNLRK